MLKTARKPIQMSILKRLLKALGKGWKDGILEKKLIQSNNWNEILLKHLVYVIGQSPDLIDTYSCWEKYLEKNIDKREDYGQFWDGKKDTSPPSFYSKEDRRHHLEMIELILYRIKEKEDERNGIIYSR